MLDEEALGERIETIHHESRRTYGGPRVHRAPYLSEGDANLQARGPHHMRRKGWSCGVRAGGSRRPFQSLRLAAVTGIGHGGAGPGLGGRHHLIALPLSATTRLLGASAPSDTAIGYESDGAYKILRSDGSLVKTAPGEFMGLAGDAIVSKNSDDGGKGGRVLGANLDGSPRWEQALSFGTPRWFFDNVSLANGSLWVRNTSDELVSIDGATGMASAPLPARAAGFGKEAKVLATTTSVLVVSTGDPEGDKSLRFVRR